MNLIKKQKLSCFGHMKRHQTLEKLILEGKVKGQRNRGRPNRSWENTVEDWKGALGSGEWDEQQKIGGTEEGQTDLGRIL